MLIPKTVGRVCMFALLAAASFVIARSLCILIARLVLEWYAPIDGDARIYAAVARGILNSLTPYRDIFETKPPGVFLLFALSLYLTGGYLIAFFLEITAVIGVLFILPVFLWNLHKRRKIPIHHWVLTLTLSILISHYLLAESGGLLAESFGAFFASLYVLIIAWDETHLRRWRIILASICMLFALAFKEPFLLSMGASAILLARDPGSLVRSFLLPLCIALLVGTALAFFLGYLEPLTHIYIPYMLNEHVGRFGPLWKRGFLIDYFFARMTDEYPLLPFIVGSLWLGVIVGMGTLTERVRIYLLIALALLMTSMYVLIHQAQILRPLWGYPHYIASVPWSIAAIIAIPVMLLWSFHILEHPANRAAFAKRMILHLILFYLLVLTVGLGGEFYWHHYVFAVPFYIAISMKFLSLPPISISHRILLYVATACTAILLIRMPFPALKTEIISRNRETARLQRNAHVFDSIMERCGFQRYLPVGFLTSTDIWAYSTFSPYGPAIFNYALNENPAHPTFNESFMRNLQETPVIVFPEDFPLKAVNENVRSILDNRFSTTPPPCAASAPSPEKLVLYFRKPDR